jgi:hypothetical protein
MLIDTYVQCVPPSELIGMYLFHLLRQLKGHRVVVNVVVATVVATVRPVSNMMGYGLEKTRVLISRAGRVPSKVRRVSII